MLVSHSSGYTVLDRYPSEGLITKSVRFLLQAMKTFGSGIWAYIACIGAALPFFSQCLSAEEIGLIGSKLSAVQNSNDLFVFFNFAPINEEKHSHGKRVISFKPTGDAFRALVTLSVATDDQGIITKLHLVVARSFIDDPKKCLYAADLVKSFLLNAAATSAGDDVSSLATEIYARSVARSSTTVLTARPTPTMPATLSPAYQTYGGSPQPQTVFYKSRKLQVLLRNGPQSEGPALDLIVSAVSVD
jgi:hypothetical protein